MNRQRKWGALAILVALGLWAAGFAAVFVVLSHTEATWQSPGAATVALQPGKWMVLERVGFSNDFGSSGLTGANPRTVNVDQLRVSGPSGDLALECLYCESQPPELPIQGDAYSAVASFTVTTVASYKITSTASADNGGQVQLVVANPIRDLTRVIPWIALAGLVGAGLLAVGVVQLLRRGSRSSATPPVAEATKAGSPKPGSRSANKSGAAESVAGLDAPPDWYPDPLGVGYERWWNGTRWTDHRRDQS